jgi:hypothetical protein
LKTRVIRYATYCISTIEKENEKVGEIDSIFVEKGKEHRNWKG